MKTGMFDEYLERFALSCASEGRWEQLSFTSWSAIVAGLPPEGALREPSGGRSAAELSSSSDRAHIASTGCHQKASGVSI